MTVKNMRYDKKGIPIEGTMFTETKDRHHKDSDDDNISEAKEGEAHKEDKIAVEEVKAEPVTKNLQENGCRSNRRQFNHHSIDTSLINYKISQKRLRFMQGKKRCPMVPGRSESLCFPEVP